MELKKHSSREKDDVEMGMFNPTPFNLKSIL